MTKTLDKFVVCVGTGTLITVIEKVMGIIDTSLVFLCLVIGLDFLTGVLCGIVEKNLSSDACTKGLFKKLFIIIYVIIAHHLDIVLHVNYIRTGICYMYATGEILSIIENGTRLGLPIPEPIKKALKILNGGNEDEDE